MHQGPGQRTMEVSGGLHAVALSPTPEGESLEIWTLGQTLQRWSAEGAVLKSAASASPAEPLLLDSLGEQLWVAGNAQLQAMNREGVATGDPILLPENTKVSAMELGYQGTVFVADGPAMRLMAVSRDKSETLVEGETLGHVNALLLNGGSLIVGTKSKLLSFNIKSSETKVLSETLGDVVALAHDHLGYFVAATSAGEIHQVQGDGSSKLLHTLSSPALDLAFDTDSRTLYLADEAGIVMLDYVALTGEDKALWATRDTRLMRSYQKNGMVVAGGEYWPSHGTTNVSYPDDILWGFYPSPEEVIEGSASEVAPPAAAITCAETSYRALQAFVDANSKKFHQAAELKGASKQFYLWVNDYSDTAADFPHEKRASKFWYWERKPAVTGRVPGFWKWETTLRADGSCHFPQAEQIDSYLSEILEEPQ